MSDAAVGVRGGWEIGERVNGDYWATVIEKVYDVRLRSQPRSVGRGMTGSFDECFTFIGDARRSLGLTAPTVQEVIAAVQKLDPAEGDAR